MKPNFCIEVVPIRTTAHDEAQETDVLYPARLLDVSVKHARAQTNTEKPTRTPKECNE